jgi:hypothetical protein
MNFSRYSRGLPSRLRFISPHLQNQIVKGQKIRVLTVCSAPAITTIVSLAHAYYIFTGGGLKEVMSALVEVGVSVHTLSVADRALGFCDLSLIVANLSVVVAFIFHLSAEDGSTSTPSPIVTFGSQPRKRVRDPGVLLTPVKFMVRLATTFTCVKSTPIVLEYLPESRPRSLKASDDEEITF